MKKEDIHVIIGLIIVLGCVLLGYSMVKSMSGVNPPFTVIESESMQHSNNSEVGIIDTGDMMLVKDPNKTTIVTLVEGYVSGEMHFGDYGSVIVYKRQNANPVIHRAILYLEYNSNTHSWSAPALANYPENMWEISGENKNPDVNNLNGTLILKLPGNYRSINDDNSIAIHLDNLNTNYNGYITMGDNNQDIDQNSRDISYNILVSKDRIKSVAWKEIPWLGAIKLFTNGKINNVLEHAHNAIANLISFLFTIILILFSIGFVYDMYKLKKENKTPTPPFPLEEENN